MPLGACKRCLFLRRVRQLQKLQHVSPVQIDLSSRAVDGCRFVGLACHFVIARALMRMAGRRFPSRGHTGVCCELLVCLKKRDVTHDICVCSPVSFTKLLCLHHLSVAIRGGAKSALLSMHVKLCRLGGDESNDAFHHGWKKGRTNGICKKPSLRRRQLCMQARCMWAAVLLPLVPWIQKVSMWCK